MPIYDYECQPCAEEHLDKLQKLKDPPPDCVSCGIPMTKKISQTNFSLKGDGWYHDGYGLNPKDTP